MVDAPKAHTESKKQKLLDQVRDAIRVRHYSIRTEDTYVQWIKRFIPFHRKRHPLEMGSLEITQFLTHLANENVAASTQNQAMSAIVFLYKQVLKKDPGEFDGIVWAKRSRKRPTVLTRDEVKSLISQLTGDKWIMANLRYGAGLRLMECLRLRVKDIDFNYCQITVRDGKGEKDRVSMLPTCVIKPLKEAVRGAGLNKKVGCHTLRHSLATQLLESGYDIRIIQEPLGHNDVKTTMINTHVLNNGGRGVRSPADEL